MQDNNLSMNYRSHEQIVNACNRFMSSWTGGIAEEGTHRYDKTIMPNPKETFTEYPQSSRSGERGRLMKLDALLISCLSKRSNIVKMRAK